MNPVKIRVHNMIVLETQRKIIAEDLSHLMVLISRGIDKSNEEINRDIDRDNIFLRATTLIQESVRSVLF